MVPASPDLLGWIAHELSLTLLEEGQHGDVRLLAGSPVDLLRPFPDILAEIAACDLVPVQELVERARAGAPGTFELDASCERPGVLLVWSGEHGSTLALYSPRAEAGVLARRAAAADLAAAVTHEVANSLTAIAGWTRMAAAGDRLPERTRQALEVVQRSARQALGSTRGLLRTMRDAGRPYVAAAVPEPTDSAEVIREVLETLRPELEANGIELEADVPEHVWGAMPAATLRLVFSNLVRNAFEALEGSGTIRVEVEVGEQRYALSVTDDGQGMSPQTLARAFDRYFTTKDTGTGLGLAMVRDTVRDEGGQIRVTSEPGKGTRFDVWLPVAGAARLSSMPPPNGHQTTPSGVHPRPILVDRRVLVVDDDAAMRSLVRTALELNWADVTVAANREEALAAAGSFDLALVDLALENERGDDLIAELRGLGRLRRAILMTGSASLEPEATRGSDAVLRKPFELDELHRMIESLLSDEPAGVGKG